MNVKKIIIAIFIITIFQSVILNKIFAGEKNYKIKSIEKLTTGTSPDLSFDGRNIAYNKKIKKML